MGLISETVNVKWHNTTKKYYEDKGYIFTKMGDEFEIKVKDLSKGSNVKVRVYCDCCKKEYELTYYNYKKQNHNGKNYCKTCINSMFRIGENNNRWNPNLTQEERENGRNYPEYIEFIKKVLARDNYTCKCCGRYGGKMNVHHLDGYDWCKEKRTDETNGITLCQTCHKNFHSIYGRGNNTKEQFEEWIGQVIGELEKYNGKLPTTRKIYCIEEDKIYDSAKQLSEILNVVNSTIYSTCNHIPKYKTIQGKHILWLDEYKQMTEEEIKKIIQKENTNPIKRIKKNNKKQVMCDGVVYNSVQKCSEFYKVKSRTMAHWLNHDCKMPKKFYDMELHYKDESMDNYEYFEIKEKIHNKNRQSNYRKVICITTGKVFNKIVDGARYYNCNSDSITSCCKGRYKSCGKLEDGTKLQWKYIGDLTEEEYIKYDIENKLKDLNWEEI